LTESKTSKSKRILTPKERRQRNREEVAEAILGAARSVMREEGVAALNLNEVARRVGMKTPSLYEYFPNKMAIYDRLFLIGVRMFYERVKANVERYGASWEGLENAFQDYMEFAQQSPELFQLVFERHVPGFQPSEATMNEAWQLLTASSRLVEQAIEGGLLQSGLPVPQVRDLIVSLMHGLTALHMANEPQLPVGAGRFGSLIPPAMQLLRRAWGPEAIGTPKVSKPPGTRIKQHKGG
jgi:AcrR family transcriptional regulator